MGKIADNQSQRLKIRQMAEKIVHSEMSQNGRLYGKFWEDDAVECLRPASEDEQADEAGAEDDGDRAEDLQLVQNQREDEQGPGDPVREILLDDG